MTTTVDTLESRGCGLPDQLVLETIEVLTVLAAHWIDAACRSRGTGTRSCDWIRSANCHTLTGVPRATLTVLIYALVYCGFCFLLDAGGHRPSFGALTERHYLLQAVLLLPASFLLWLLHSAVAHGMARALGGRGTLRDTVAAVGPAFALPMLLFLVLPDLITFLVFGFEALGKVMRFVAPLAIVGRIVLGVQAVRSAHQLSRGRALVAEVIALSVEGIATAPWLR